MLKTVMNSHVWTKKVTKLDWRSTIYSVVKFSSYFCVWYFLFLIFFIYIVNIGYGKFYVKIFLLVCPVFLTQSVYHVTNTFREILSPSSYQMMGKVSLKTNIWQVLLITRKIIRKILVCEFYFWMSGIHCRCTCFFVFLCVFLIKNEKFLLLRRPWAHIKENH